MNRNLRLAVPYDDEAVVALQYQRGRLAPQRLNAETRESHVDSLVSELEVFCAQTDVGSITILVAFLGERSERIDLFDLPLLRERCPGSR